MQISYHQSLDPYHTTFRLLLVASHVVQKTIHSDTLRILDYYYLFPKELSEFRYSKPNIRLRKLARETVKDTNYASLPNSIEYFSRMKPVHQAALESLSAKNIIDRQALTIGEVKVAPENIPAAIRTRIESKAKDDYKILSILSTLAKDYEVRGIDGLKGRSGLLEYRYDPV